MNGIINLLKPPCLSSAQAVSFIKRLTKEKVGHAGTLDPEACGVLPIMIGKATRLFDYIAEKQKTYVAEIAFGASTDTQDATGQVTVRGDQFPTKEKLQEILSLFTGSIMQCPPSFSAIKQDGKPLYKLAREGKMVQTNPRMIDVEKIDILGESSEHSFLLRIYCGKGTYIRTLCHDIGNAIGCPAHMRMLIREKTGSFNIAQAITMEEFELFMKLNCKPGEWLVRMEDTISHFPTFHAPAHLWKKCINGAVLKLDEIQEVSNLENGQMVVIYCCEQLIGIYYKNESTLKVRTMLHT
ncbi:MAG: tRNA pseudouridine(55) synthase TruB [Clostridiales bacterium]|nr:tRNA pseudouridine(55) synthase TruB [Clostridiales bacterium]